MRRKIPINKRNIRRINHLPSILALYRESGEFTMHMFIFSKKFIKCEYGSMPLIWEAKDGYYVLVPIPSSASCELIEWSQDFQYIAARLQEERRRNNR